jgi:hypothetical protein
LQRVLLDLQRHANHATCCMFRILQLAYGARTAAAQVTAGGSRHVARVARPDSVRSAACISIAPPAARVART